MTALTITERRRRNFAAKILPEPTSGCWLWDGFVNPTTGYGMFRMSPDPSEALWGAHRASWHFHKGSIPVGMFVCHKCDVRSCVNPDHLFLGTAQDNMRDASRKGKMKGNPISPRLRGTDNPQSVLTAAEVQEIRASSAYGVVLAKQYGVSGKTISRIRRNEAWRHL